MVFIKRRASFEELHQLLFSVSVSLLNKLPRPLRCFGTAVIIVDKRRQTLYFIGSFVTSLTLTMNFNLYPDCIHRMSPADLNLFLFKYRTRPLYSFFRAESSGDGPIALRGRKMVQNGRQSWKKDINGNF